MQKLAARHADDFKFTAPQPQPQQMLPPVNRVLPGGQVFVGQQIAEPGAAPQYVLVTSEQQQVRVV